MREKSFERVYYFHGDDDFLKDSLAREFIDAAVPANARDFDCEVLRGLEVSAEVLDTALATPPLMHERRLVVLRDVTGLRRDARKALSMYLRRPAAGTVLLLVQRAGEKPSAELRDAGAALEFKALAPDRVPRWIEHYTSSALAVAIAPDAVVLLQSVVGNDVPQLAAELAKLASHASDGTITTRDVEAVVGVRHEESLGALLDAVAAKEAVRASRLVDAALAQPKVTLVSIVMALTTQTLALACGRAALDRGLPRAGLDRFLFSLLRESRVYPGRSWGEAVASWTRAVPEWTVGDAGAALASLVIADSAAKDARLTSEEHFLSTLVVSLCMGELCVVA